MLTPEITLRAYFILWNSRPRAARCSRATRHHVLLSVRRTKNGGRTLPAMKKLIKFIVEKSKDILVCYLGVNISWNSDFCVAIRQQRLGIRKNGSKWWLVTKNSGSSVRKKIRNSGIQCDSGFRKPTRSGLTRKFQNLRPVGRKELETSPEY